MTDLTLYLAFYGFVACACLGLAWPLARKRRVSPMICLLCFVGAVSLVSMAPSFLGVWFGNWNWLGKILSVACSLLALRVFRLSAKEAGLTMPRTGRAWLISLAGIVAALAFEVARSVITGDVHLATDTETFAFQATMPGIDEELCFRGVDLALLMRAFPVPRSGLPVWFLPMAITTIMFIAGHMVAFHGGVPLVMWKDPLLDALPIGALLGLLRIATGSLVGPVLAHNAANLGNHLTSLWYRQ